MPSAGLTLPRQAASWAAALSRRPHQSTSMFGLYLSSSLSLVLCQAWRSRRLWSGVFNAAYFQRVPRGGRRVVRSFRRFFFPLDQLYGWNRLYGHRGFHQFQCVIPLANTEALREMLGQIAKSGLVSPLAVLKRLGPGRAGHLSFPMEGYTLAVDLPNRPPVARLVETLDRITAAAAGRLYLAKNSLSCPSRVQAMYPELSRWRAAANAVDEARSLETDLVRRLHLRETP